MSHDHSSYLYCYVIDIQDDFTAWDYLVMGVYGLIVVISLFGNGLVFSVIIRTR